MQISDILKKEEITQQEMEFLVEEYIFAKKGHRVKITTLLPFEWGLLNHAFWTAFKHFCDKREN
jgi:hypothetical protein